MPIRKNAWEVGTYRKNFEGVNKSLLPSITFLIFVEAVTIFFDGPVFLLIGSRGFSKRGLTPLRNKLFCQLFRELS